MATLVKVSVQREFTVGADPQTAFELVADVPKSASHFPGLEECVDLGGGKYQWNMAERGAAGFTLSVVYAAEYTNDPSIHAVQWTPVKGIGNSALGGSWAIEANGDGATMKFVTEGEIAAPVPKLMAKMAKGIVQGEFEKDVDRYIQNLQQALA